jgi:hypothetical protein
MNKKVEDFMKDSNKGKMEKTMKNPLGIGDYIKKKIKRKLFDFEPYLLFTNNLKNHC